MEDQRKDGRDTGVRPSADQQGVARREPFPLLADPVNYTPDTLDIWSNRPEMGYWLGVLGDQVQTVVEKAVASEGNSQGTRARCCRLRLFTPPACSGHGALQVLSGRTSSRLQLVYKAFGFCTCCFQAPMTSQTVWS